MTTNPTDIILIEAVQLTWGTWSEVCDFVSPGPFPEGMRGVYVDEDGNATDTFPGPRTGGETARIGLLIPTREGTVLAVEDDWIVRGDQGDLYPVKPDVFDQACKRVTP